MFLFTSRNVPLFTYSSLYAALPILQKDCTAQIETYVKKTHLIDYKRSKYIHFECSFACCSVVARQNWTCSTRLFGYDPCKCMWLSAAFHSPQLFILFYPFQSIFFFYLSVAHEFSQSLTVHNLSEHHSPELRKKNNFSWFFQISNHQQIYWIIFTWPNR